MSKVRKSNTKKVIMALLMILLSNLVACKTISEENDDSASNVQYSSEETQKSLSSLLEKVGEVEWIKEYEGDYAYVVSDKTTIDELMSLIVTSTDSIHMVTQEDIGPMRTGGPMDASWLTIKGTDGTRLELFVNDDHMPTDLVCILTSSSFGTEYYGYGLNMSIYKDIKEITHTGEKHHLGED